MKNLLEQGGNLSDATLAQQRSTLHHQLQATAERIKLLDARVVSQNTLLEHGLITHQTLLTTQSDLTTARLEVEQLRGQLQQLSLKQLETRKQAETELSQIQAQVAEARRKVEGLVESERLSTRVESPYAGRVVEIRAAPGALVSAGTPLLAIEPDGGMGEALEVAIYLSPADGKKVAQGMRVQISPATVRREEYGYLMGEVRFVSDYPATEQSMRMALQNDALVRELSGNASPIELRARLLRSDNGNISGYQWSSPQGPPVKVTAGTPAHADIIVRHQPPISLVIPALQRMLGA